MWLSFQAVRSVKDHIPFSENNAATILYIYVSTSLTNENHERPITLTTWSEYSSPSI